MARRNRRCRNCPDTLPAVVAAPIAAPVLQPLQDAATKTATKFAGKTLDPNLLTREGESARLWNHVLFGTTTCIKMIEGYADLGLPGNPLPQIQELILHLTRIQTKIETNNADRHSS